MAPLLPALPGLTLVRNGSYSRLLSTTGGPSRELIFRKKCPGCRTGFSLLPNDVVPLHSYGLPLVSARLHATICGDSLRSRQFYADRNLVPDDIEFQDVSWSDRLNQQPLRPAHQLFARWSRKWRRGAQEWLQVLLFACIFAGCDLKKLLADDPAGLMRCPADLRPIALAAGLIALLRQQPLSSTFPSAMLVLSCAPSHKRFRVAGRPPPQYGGELEFMVSGAHRTED